MSQGTSGSLSFLLGAYSIYLRIIKNIDLSDTFLPVVAVFMVMIGILLFVSGILADICVKTYYKSFATGPYTVETVLM